MMESDKPPDPAIPHTISVELDESVKKIVGKINERIGLEVEEQIKTLKETSEEIDKKRRNFIPLKFPCHK